MIYCSQWSENVGREACGPAATKMALSDSGITPTLLELVTLSDPERDGTVAADLIGLFTHYGVKAQVAGGAFPTVFPCIVLFNYSKLSRSSVQDTAFQGLHWFVLLGIEGDQIVVNDPDFWGARMAEGDHKHYKLSEVQAGYAGQIITWTNKMTTLPTTGVVKSDVETLPKFLRVRDGANSPNILAFLADGATVNILGSANDTAGRLWYQISMKMWNPSLFSDQGLTTPVSSTLNGWVAGWLIQTNAPPVPPPPPPPPATSVAKLGFHTLGNSSKPGVDAGARFGMCMDGKENVQLIASVGGVGMFRRYFTYKPDVEVMAQDLASLPDGSVGTGFNEWEQMDGGSPAGILAGASWQVAVATRLRQLNPKVHFAAGTFSTGCPDYTNPAICAAVQQGYAAAYNSGLIWWDQHLYSPTMDWIFKQMPSGLMAMQAHIVRAEVGKDKHVATWVDYAPQDHAVEEPLIAAAIADSPTYQWWFELRWLFPFTRCGFDINSPSRVVSGECGIDEGGSGGFVGHNATDEQVVAYWQRWLQLQRAPVVIGGKSYSSPFLGGAAFQLGSTRPDPGAWGSYALDKYLPAMKVAGLFL